MVKVVKKEGLLKRIVKWLFNKKLLKNKLYSMVIMLLGYLTIPVGDGDCTAFLFTLFLGLPIFFSKENVVD